MLFPESHLHIFYKNKRKNSLPGNNSTCRNPAPISSGDDFPGRAASCISGKLSKGSLTVEAALALPLFFLTVVSLISLLGIYSSFVKTVISLQTDAEKLAMAEVYTLAESSSPVKLVKTVEQELAFLPFDAKSLHVKAGACVLPWTGRSDYSSLEAASSSKGRLYYLSDYQSVYHTSSGCSYLSLQISAVSSESLAFKRNESGENYHACEKCVGQGETGTVVYVTGNGEHYHNSASCSGLKRSVHLVEEEEIQGLHMCTRCMKREQAS